MTRPETEDEIITIIGKILQTVYGSNSKELVILDKNIIDQAKKIRQKMANNMGLSVHRVFDERIIGKL